MTNESRTKRTTTVIVPDPASLRRHFPLMEENMITRTCPWCKALLKKWSWLQPWKCLCCGWE